MPKPFLRISVWALAVLAAALPELAVLLGVVLELEDGVPEPVDRELRAELVHDRLAM